MSGAMVVESSPSLEFDISALSVLISISVRNVRQRLSILTISSKSRNQFKVVKEICSRREALKVNVMVRVIMVNAMVGVTMVNVMVGVTMEDIIGVHGQFLAQLLRELLS
jgi:hypothetical protein